MITPYKVTHDGIELIGVCDVLDLVDPNGTVEYMETGRLICEWCAANDATTYSAPRENYSDLIAADVAREAGVSRVVCEDLS